MQPNWKCTSTHTHTHVTVWQADQQLNLQTEVSISRPPPRIRTIRGHLVVHLCILLPLHWKTELPPPLPPVNPHHNNVKYTSAYSSGSMYGQHAATVDVDVWQSWEDFYYFWNTARMITVAVKGLIICHYTQLNKAAAETVRNNATGQRLNVFFR